MEKNDIINLKITDVNIQGMGIGRHEGMVVFVPQAAVQDQLIVKIIKIHKDYAVGKIEKIISPSSDRVSLDCVHYPKCGGCSFRHISYDAELSIKSRHILNCLERIGGFRDIKLERIIRSEKINFYRNKSQIPVGKNSKNEVVCGFFSSHSHRIVDCKNCLIHPREFNQILGAIKQWISQTCIAAYDEKSHKGLIRHIYLRYAETTGEIMVCLVINGESIPMKESLISCLKKLNLNIISVYLNINTEKSNVILGKRCKLIWGKKEITDYLCGLRFDISPLSFYQVNRGQAEKIYKIIAESISFLEKSTVLDLYCGVGTIGLCISSHAHRVVGIEIVKEAIEDANKNAAINKISNTKFVCCDVSDLKNETINSNSKYEVVILDPPRKGCDLRILESVIKMRPNKLVYVSCNPATLARDLKILCQSEFKIQKVIPVDMFPRTGHVETIVLLESNN